MRLSYVRAVVFDLDGTIYCGDTPQEGAVSLLEKLCSQGIQVFYCTNNSTKTRQDICTKLNAMKLPATPETIYSAAYAAAHYLKQNSCSNIYCFGADGLQDELRSAGLSLVSDPADASIVLIGLDSTVDYERISGLLPLRNKTCALVACNRDKFFPSDNGIVQLGCGFIVSLVENALDRKVDYTVGKPNPYMLEMLTAEHGITMDEIVMVGDSLESDIALARAAGCPSVYLSSRYEAPGVVQVKSLHELGSMFE